MPTIPWWHQIKQDCSWSGKRKIRLFPTLHWAISSRLWLSNRIEPACLEEWTQLESFPLSLEQYSWQMWWGSQEWQWGQGHNWWQQQRYLHQGQCCLPSFPRPAKKVSGGFPWSSWSSLYSNVPSCCYHLVFQMLILLTWFPFTFQVGAFFRLEGCFNSNVGTVLVISSLLWGFFHIHTAFIDWLSSLRQPLPWPIKNHHCKHKTTLQARHVMRFRHW